MRQSAQTELASAPALQLLKRTVLARALALQTLKRNVLQKALELNTLVDLALHAVIVDVATKSNRMSRPPQG